MIIDKDDQHWKMMLYQPETPKTPEQLIQMAADYFRWCEMNPIFAKRTLTGGKQVGEKVEFEFVRPFEIKAFCIHCGINERFINDIKDTYQKHDPWYIAMEKILMIIYNQNLEGAIVDMYNPIMISKVLKMDSPDNSNLAKIQVEIINSGPRLEQTENSVIQNLDF